MSVSRTPTHIPASMPTMVVVTSFPALVEACESAAATAGSARSVECTLDDLTTTAAKHRPFALVVDEDSYNFDPVEFQNLARDVGAQLIRINAVQRSKQELADRLIPKLAGALQLRQMESPPTPAVRLVGEPSE